MNFFLLCLVQGLSCLLENQHSSGILGRCTAMWLPDPNERCKPPPCVCVGMRGCGCVSVSPIDAKYARTDIWAHGASFTPVVCFLCLFCLLWALKDFSLVRGHWCSALAGTPIFFFLFLKKKSLGTADRGPPSGRGQECF